MLKMKLKKIIYYLKEIAYSKSEKEKILFFSYQCDKYLL